MSYIQQIQLRKYLRQGLHRKPDNYHLEEILDSYYLPKLPDQDRPEFFGAELSLGYLEFHKVFELDAIIKKPALRMGAGEYEISLDQLQNIIGEFRALIDKQTDSEKKNYWLTIERKLSDLYQMESVVDYEWQIVYWHEGG
jgi:hypothetical protein